MWSFSVTLVVGLLAVWLAAFAACDCNMLCWQLADLLGETDCQLADE